VILEKYKGGTGENPAGTGDKPVKWYVHEELPL
jgi:hypothetical protein